jgi:hypothetical protein
VSTKRYCLFVSVVKFGEEKDTLYLAAYMNVYPDYPLYYKLCDCLCKRYAQRLLKIFKLRENSE